MRMNGMDWVAWVLIVVGAINWGLIGFFNWNLVGAIFGGDMSSLSRIIYSLVGLAGVYMIVRAFTYGDERNR